MKKKVKVLYIAGNGHSGSTLLDIILGNSPSVFSSGELTFITRESIDEEYCSCGEVIGNCKLWSIIMNKWLEKIDLSIEEYRVLRLKYERNKATHTVLFNKFFPTKDFLAYCTATKVLFECIQEVTNSEIIIDSSKTPQRIPILERIVDLKVIHLCRDAKGVLNSAKKSYKKDISAGVEVDLPSRRTSKTLIEWVFVNLMTSIFSFGLYSVKLKYKDYIGNLKYLEKLDGKIKITGDSFATYHIMAGNKMRLKNEINVDNNVGFNYSRLSQKQRFLAGLFDKVFYWWS